MQKADQAMDIRDKLKIKEHFNKTSRDYDYWKKKNHYYYEQLKVFYKKHIPPGERIVEIGSGTGDILAAVSPREGTGIDISFEMVQIAKEKYPQLRFFVSDAEALALKDKFRYVIMSDLIDHVYDIWKVIGEAGEILEEGGELILTTINPVWDFLFDISEALRLKMPEGPHNFVNIQNISSLAKLFSFKIKSEGYFLFLPKRIFLVSDILNMLIPHIPLLRKLCFCQYLIARKEGPQAPLERNLSVSIIIPCYNEENNVPLCLPRMPDMGSSQEIIFIDDGSADKTKERIEELMRQDKRIKLISYPARKGKGYAVKKGFALASKDILIILDADMSVMPEDLPKFFSVINRGKADFANGTRMVYPVKESMRILHVIGNKIYGIIFTWLLGQRITDTLCGTKALLRKDYENFKHLSKDDPWGDFDLLLGAAKSRLKIVEIPVRYQKRVFGYSKMRPFKHGFILLLRVLRAFKETYLRHI